MKKRILSLILVLVMLMLTLTSCSYNFANDDMSNYVTVDKAAFEDALKKLVIEDGDFTTDPETRAKKVEETIRNTLGKDVDVDAKIFEGVVGTYDVLYYAYYATAGFKKGEEVETAILYASNMKEASAVKLQLGMISTAGDLDLAINEALKDKDIKDYLYKTNTDTATELKVGDEIYVSYTYSYTEGSKTKSVTVSYEKMTLTDGDALSEKILSDCKTVGTKNKSESGEETFKITVDGVERTYKNVVAEWVVESATELGAFEVKDFDDTKTVTDVNGTSRKLKDAVDGVITYHVYPVYYLEAPEFDGKAVLDILTGAGLTTDLFDVFKDESYKATEDGKEKKLSVLIEELAALCSKRDSAESSLSSAKSTLTTKKEALNKAGASATEAQKQAVTDAETAVKTAETNLKTAQDNVDKKIKVILTTGTDIETKLLDGYRELAEKSLKNQYDNEIYEKIAKEVWKLIDTTIKVDLNKLPEKAVEEAYERILENHEYTFYTGTKSSTDGTYYKFYKGDFKAYLIATFAKDKTYEDALAAILEDAKEAVAPIVKVYAVAEAFGCVIGDKEFKEEYVKGNASYDYYVDQYGETNVRTAIQFSKLMSDILEVETYEKDEGDHKAGDMVEYIDGKYLPFKNIKYTIKVEEEEKTEDTEG